MLWTWTVTTSTVWSYATTGVSMPLPLSIFPRQSFGPAMPGNVTAPLVWLYAIASAGQLLSVPSMVTWMSMAVRDLKSTVSFVTSCEPEQLPATA